MNIHQANPRPTCPECASQYVKRYGKNSAGHQRYLCKKCGFQFRRTIEELKVRELGAIAGKVEIGRGFRWGSGL